MTWQPIETAPRDGTEILLCRGNRVTSGHWTEPSEHGRPIYGRDGAVVDMDYDEWDACWLSWDGGFTDDAQPTHWMPLPAPPYGSMEGSA